MDLLLRAPQGREGPGNWGMLSIFLNGCQVTSKVQVMKPGLYMLFFSLSQKAVEFEPEDM